MACILLFITNTTIMNSLHQKTAIIIGAGNGIGYTTAKLFKPNGAIVSGSAMLINGDLIVNPVI